MTKKITLLLITALLLTPLGVILAKAPSDSEFQTKIQEMRDARKEFKEARSQAADLENANVNVNANSNDNTNKSKNKEEILARREAHRKTVLQKIVDIQISYFERAQKRVDKMPNITDAEKTNLTNQINSTISALNAKKTEVDAATVTDSLKTLAKDLKTSFRNYHQIVKTIVDAIHASKVADAENTAENRAEAIEVKLDELASEGKDVTDLKSQLASAQTLISDAQALREAGNNKDAVAKLKEAYTIFKSVSKSAKNL